MSRATALGCGAIGLWAALALLSQWCRALPPFEILAITFAISGAAGMAVLTARGKLGALRQPPVAWAHGVGGLFGYHALYFASLARAPVAEASLLNYLWPLLIVVFASILLGARLRTAHWAGLVCGIAGCVLLLGPGFSGDAAPRVLGGYALAIAAALTWALYSVLGAKLRAVPTEAVAGFCAATGVLAALAHVSTETSVRPDAAAALALLLLGLGPAGAAFFLWDVGIKRGDPRLLGILAYATPVLSTVLLCAARAAPFSWRLVGAALLVGAGGLIAALAGKRRAGRGRAGAGAIEQPQSDGSVRSPI